MREDFGHAWRTWTDRLFGRRWPIAEIAVLVAFMVASVVETPIVVALAFALFIELFIIAVVQRRSIDIALLAGLYYVFRFNLIAASPEFRYGTDLITVVGAGMVLLLLLGRSARLRWYDWVFIAFGVYSVGIGVIRDVPVTPLLVQLRALLGVYPVFVLVRELGFQRAGDRATAALAFYHLFAWALLAQAFIEKASGKLLFMTSFVRLGGISFTNWPRVYGWTANPNSLGALCVLLIGVGLLLAAWGFRGRWLSSGVTLYFATLMLSVSRSALWGLLVLLAIFLFRPAFEGTARRVIGVFAAKRFAIGAAIAVAAIILSVVVPLILPRLIPSMYGAEEGFGIYGRFITGEDEVEGSMKGGRLFSLRTGLTIATRGVDDLLIGQGPATYGSAGSNFWESPLYKPFDIPEGFYADMFMVMMVVEVGLIGLGLFALGLVGLLRSNDGMPLAWRIGILSVLTLWCLFYNVPELAMLFFPILVLMGIPLGRPAPAQAAALSEEVWQRS